MDKEVQDIHYFVYIITNKTGSVLYTGMTHDLPQRIIAHKQEFANGFTKKYKVNRLVYYEVAESKEGALYREKQIKDYSRQKKLNLISILNPLWKDLSVSLME
jgi:putative endonuclease